MPVMIHGNKYVTVSERVTQAHEELDKISITTEVLSTDNDSVVVRATVVTDKGTFNGTSASNANKAIEKVSPYEVAETSAIGRALGFAGYGIVEGIATADEVKKAEEEAFTAKPVTAFSDTKTHDAQPAEMDGNVLCSNCQRFYHDPKWKVCFKCKGDPDWFKS